MKQLLAAISAGLALSVAPASAAIIFSDSFESPDLSNPNESPNANWAVFQNAGDNGQSWMTIEGTGIELQRDGLIVPAFDGDQYVELDSDRSRGGDGSASTTNTLMATNIAFQEGRKYNISFAYRPRTNNGGDDNGIRLSVGAKAGSAYSVDSIIAEQSLVTPSDWVVVSVMYIAEAGINAIGLQAFGRDNTLGGFVDLVEVAEVPLPAGVLLFGTGLIGLRALRRKAKTA